MKRILIFLCVSLTLMSVSAQTEFVKNVPESRTAIAIKVAEGITPDKEKQGAYRYAIEEAFDKYFNDKGNKCKAYEQQYIDTLTQKNSEIIRALNAKINALEEQNKKLKPEQIQKEISASVDSVKKKLSTRIDALAQDSIITHDALVRHESTIANLNNEVSALKLSASELKNKADRADKAISKLTLKENQLNNAYAECLNQQLGNITDPNGKLQSITNYKDFLDILELTNEYLTPEKKKDIAVIESTLKVNEFYIKAADALKKKYDAVEINKLISEAKQLNKYVNNISALNQSNFQEIMSTLSDYERITRNFNYVLDNLATQGSIPGDRKYQKEAIEGINIDISNVTRDDPNAVAGKYNEKYVYLNNKLEALRKRIQSGAVSEQQLKDLISNARK